MPSVNYLTLPIAVVAHPARQELVNDLVSEVAPNQIFWDTDGIGCTANHLRAWKWLAEQEDTWGVILEDDVVPVDNFLQRRSTVPVPGSSRSTWAVVRPYSGSSRSVWPSLRT